MTHSWRMTQLSIIANLAWKDLIFFLMHRFAKKLTDIFFIKMRECHFCVQNNPWRKSPPPLVFSQSHAISMDQQYRGYTVSKTNVSLFSRRETCFFKPSRLPLRTIQQKIIVSAKKCIQRIFGKSRLTLETLRLSIRFVENWSWKCV